jgi:putative transcriptional regulator
MTPQMWARLRAMTDEEALAAARRDPDNPPLEDRDPASLGPAGHITRATHIRRALRMSKAEFAKTFHIPLAALREWEHHFSEPDETAQAYLEVIAREPDAVRRALTARSAKTRKAA